MPCNTVHTTLVSTEIYYFHPTFLIVKIHEFLPVNIETMIVLCLPQLSSLLMADGAESFSLNTDNDGHFCEGTPIIDNHSGPNSS